jgi:hypothetical protein
MHRSGVIPPLQRIYDGPYAILHRDPHSFTIQVWDMVEIVSVSWLKPSTDADVKPGSPQHRGRPPGAGTDTKPVHPHPGGSRFQTPWSLHHHAKSSLKNAREPFFPNPVGFFLHALGWLLLPSLHSSSTCSNSRDRQRESTSDLASSEASAGGRGPAESLATPLDPISSSRMVYCTMWCTPCYLYSQ